MRSLAIVLLVGCGGGDTVSLSGGGTTGGDATETPAPPPEEFVPPSEKLGCGLPCNGLSAVCAETDVEDGIAIRCEEGVIVCEQCASTGASCIDGGCVRPCADQGLECCPNARWCQDGGQAICNELGTEFVVQPCVDGLDCVSGQCLPARPQVHVLFDTSGSMAWSPAGEQLIGTWPLCDDPSAPQSRLGLSKKVFAELFADEQHASVLFSLQRFPQTVNGAANPLCPTATYLPQDRMTDHVGKFSISDGPTGDWFEQNLDEIMVVRFPSAPGVANHEELVSWLDFTEATKITSDSCLTHGDCPGNGMCVNPEQGGRCRSFTDPEIRATGWTPLGTSMFYAAEYFRRHVVVDGRSCTLDADCLTATHLCVDGVCRDPNRFCRQRSIVVFTDGVDTSSPGSWWTPVVQAKRLRAGLDCASDDECFEGFECSEGTCQPDGSPGNPCQVIGSWCAVESLPFPDAVAAGRERLYDANSDPIRITVHVVDVSGEIGSDSAGMAAYGGGLLIGESLQDQEALLAAIRVAVDWKDIDFCDEAR